MTSMPGYVSTALCSIQLFKNINIYIVTWDIKSGVNK